MAAPIEFPQAFFTYCVGYGYRLRVAAEAGSSVRRLPHMVKT
jgi:hypothetical protein